MDPPVKQPPRGAKERPAPHCPRAVRSFDIGADGSLSNRRVWANVGSHSPDGICLDRDGAVWYADVGDRCCVRVADDGEVLDLVQLDRGAFACMLGGADASTLFVVAAHWPGPQRLTDYTGWDGMVVGIPAPAPSAGWPGAPSSTR